MSRYIKITAGTPSYGTEEEFFQVFDDDTSNEFIDEIAEEIRQNQAESFEYLATGWDEDWESEEQKENYYADCYVSWEEISKEEFWEECNYSLHSLFILPIDKKESVCYNCRLAYTRSEPKYPLYHTLHILSSDFDQKYCTKFFPKVCAI